MSLLGGAPMLGTDFLPPVPSSLFGREGGSWSCKMGRVSPNAIAFQLAFWISNAVWVSANMHHSVLWELQEQWEMGIQDFCLVCGYILIVHCMSLGI